MSKLFRALFVTAAATGLATLAVMTVKYAATPPKKAPIRPAVPQPTTPTVIEADTLSSHETDQLLQELADQL